MVVGCSRDDLEIALIVGVSKGEYRLAVENAAHQLILPWYLDVINLLRAADRSYWNNCCAARGDRLIRAVDIFCLEGPAAPLLMLANIVLRNHRLLRSKSVECQSG